MGWTDIRFYCSSCVCFCCYCVSVYLSFSFNCFVVVVLTIITRSCETYMYMYMYIHVLTSVQPGHRGLAGSPEREAASPAPSPMEAEGETPAEEKEGKVHAHTGIYTAQALYYSPERRISTHRSNTILCTRIIYMATSLILRHICTVHVLSPNTNCLQQVHRAKEISRNAFSTSVTVRSSGMLPSGERHVRHSLQVSITIPTHLNMDCKGIAPNHSRPVRRL